MGLSSAILPGLFLIDGGFSCGTGISMLWFGGGGDSALGGRGEILQRGQDDSRVREGAISTIVKHQNNIVRITTMSRGNICRNQ